MSIDAQPSQGAKVHKDLNVYRLGGETKSCGGEQAPPYGLDRN